MNTNGKGSKRRPETKPGTYIQNWEVINWKRQPAPKKPNEPQNKP